MNTIHPILQSSSNLLSTSAMLQSTLLHLIEKTHTHTHTLNFTCYWFFFCPKSLKRKTIETLWKVDYLNVKLIKGSELLF